MAAHKRRLSEVEELRRSQMPSTSDVIKRRARDGTLGEADIAVSKELGTSRRAPRRVHELGASSEAEAGASENQDPCAPGSPLGSVTDERGVVDNIINHNVASGAACLESPRCPAHACGQVFVDDQEDRIYCTR